MTTELLHELALASAARAGSSTALRFKGEGLTYAALASQIDAFAASLYALGLERQDRVAIYLPKQFETVIAMFGAARAGCVFVPVNPLLKAPQVAHILRDCNVRVLVTSPDRAQRSAPRCCGSARTCMHLVIVGGCETPRRRAGTRCASRGTPCSASGPPRALHRVIDMPTSPRSSTPPAAPGSPKGVVLSHRNMVTGAQSVAQYLENTPDDRLLAVLPFSFDYGFSQLIDGVPRRRQRRADGLPVAARHRHGAAERERITGLAGVPPLWIAARRSAVAGRGSTSTCATSRTPAARMPRATLRQAARGAADDAAIPDVRPDRSVPLAPICRRSEIDRRPDSMGKAIPNAEILVVRPDGTPCAPNEPGELVHRGSLVALGYWNDPEKTAERFKPAPGQRTELLTHGDGGVVRRHGAHATRKAFSTSSAAATR